jgi:hypothetical protein
MHRRPSVTVPLPRVDAGLVSNLLLLAGLAAVCVAVAFLTDWRWGLLAAGVVTVAANVYLQRIGAFEAAEPQSVVTSIRSAAAGAKSA